MMLAKRHQHSPLQRFFHAKTSNNKKISILPLQSNQNYSNYVRLLSSCNKVLSSLLQIHAHLIVLGLEKHNQASTHLARSYLSFEKHDSARFLFDSVQNPSLILCNSMIRAYTAAKKHEEAVKVYNFMLSIGLEPDNYTFTFVLKACTGALDFELGVLVHKDVIFRGLECDPYIGTGLVDMYCKMGNLELARRVFDRISEKDVVAWNAMISGLSQSEEPNEAFGYFWSMQLRGLEPDLVSILNLVPAVSRLADSDACKSIHGYVIRKGLDAVVSNGLIDMYAKCGKVDVAFQIFENMPKRDDVTWGTMMAGHAHNKRFLEVLGLFDCMKKENVRFSKASVVSAVMAAAEMGNLGKGKEIHDCARQHGIDSDVLVATPIITMYAKCKRLDMAKELFQGLERRDLVAWSAIIAAFVESGYPEEGLSLFRDMKNECLQANNITLLSVLPACAEVLSPRLGKSVHAYAVKTKMDLDISIGAALVSMYAKCGVFTVALTIFNRMPCKDVVTWNALISGYSQIGNPYHAMKIFHRLQSSEICPDSGTMVGLLPACALLCDLDQGSCFHGQIVKLGFDSDRHVINALIDMYAKCGSVSFAEFLFNRTEFIKEEISWNVMIAGYLHNGNAEKAMYTFSQMKLESFKPNLVTMVSVLPAVAYLSALREGMTLHAYVIRMGFQSSTLVANCLIDMYAKCGQLGYSEDIFHEIKNKDTVSWNVMLAGYAVHGQGKHAIELFTVMQETCIGIDALSFLNVLSACRYAGLIEEGRKVFNLMSQKYQFKPALEHYACMVDLLGRAGLFDEVLGLIKEMPLEPDAGVWGALLGACTMHSNVHLAELARDCLSKLEPENPTQDVVLSSIYAECGRWRDAGGTRSNLVKTGLKKSPGWSLV